MSCFRLGRWAVLAVALTSVGATRGAVGEEEPETGEFPRPVTTVLEAQIALGRRDFSCGSIDGVYGLQTASAVKAFQGKAELPITGILDEATKAKLTLDAEPMAQMALSAQDLARLQPLRPTWQEKSEQTALDYETALEMLAERTHSAPALIRRLNPKATWDKVDPSMVFTVPSFPTKSSRPKAERIVIYLADHVLEPLDGDDKVLAHFPVSIAARVEKRPAGELHVVVLVSNPDYTFEPENFPESEEAKTLGHKLILPPGPNNPVGMVWIGLDRPGYGIHGTPEPEHVGRTESHGCFRMTNWDAVSLLDYVEIGTPVEVVP
jgi:lipoprotein-anchoring transpeptidase ErfK/SrfK